MKKCQKCGTQVSDDMSFCTNCGSPDLIHFSEINPRKKVKAVRVKSQAEATPSLEISHNTANEKPNVALTEVEKDRKKPEQRSQRGLIIGIIAIIAMFCIALIGTTQNSNKASNSTIEPSSTQETTSINATSPLDEKERTKESIDPYLEHLGEYVEDDSVSLSEELHNRMDSVYVMGELGSISYKMSDSPPTVSFFGWESNNTYTMSEFNSFLKKMDQFLEEENHVMALDGYSDETHFWADHYQDAYVICWYEQNRIMLGWVYDDDIDDSSNDYDSYTTSSYSTTTHYYTTSKQAFLCEVCGKYATNTWEGLSGETEYYCDKHYQELLEMYYSMFG